MTMKPFHGFGLAVIIVAVIAACGSSGKDPSSGNGPSPCTAGNGQNTNGKCGGSSVPTPPPTATPAAAPLHVPNVSFVGQYLAGLDGGVTQTQIQTNLTIAEGALTSSAGSAGGRAISASDNCVHTCGMLYFDFFRPNNTFAPAMAADGAYSECGGPTASWFLHAKLGNQCDQGQRVGTNGIGNVQPFVDNFSNLATATWWRSCFDGTASEGACNGFSPTPGPTSSTGDTNGGRTYNSGDIILSDTSATAQGNIISAPAPIATTFEIAADPVMQGLLQTWIPLAAKHINNSVYNIWMNGASRGANSNQSASKAHTCASSIVNSSGWAQDCLVLVNIAPAVTCGIYEFWGQAGGGGGNVRFNDALVVFAVNSAASIIANGKCVAEISEYESQTFNPAHPILGTAPSTMMLYYASYLLTYNPLNPTAEYSWLDVEDHDPTQSSPLLSSWPIQQIVPTGNVAIPVTAYNQNAGLGGGIGGSGCQPDPGVAGAHTESDTGGIISYLIPGSCGTSVTGSSGNSGFPFKAGSYGNANSACAVATVSIGACAWFFNLTNASFVIPCSEITALGTALGKTWGIGTFTHQVDLGTGATTLKDVVSGGSLTYNVLAYTCGTTPLPSDTGIIVTP